MSLSGFPFGVPAGDGGGEARAVLGVAVLVVGGAVAEPAVTDVLVAGAAGPGKGPAVDPGSFRAGVPGGVCVGGFGDGLACLLGVAAGCEVHGDGDVVPGVPGFAGLADVAEGGVAGGEFEVSGGAHAGERLDVAGRHVAAG